MVAPEIQDAILLYFNIGLQYLEILDALASQHGFVLSLRHLKRILRENGLQRRNYSDLGTTIDFIRSQLNTSSRLHGYRWMHAKCLEHGIRAKTEDVRIILQLLDPESVVQRRRRRLQRRQYFSKGPNFIWHVDSYDKLKPFGICINGCIDGFSRRIIWLKAAHTSSNPRVIGSYYVDAVERLGGCPRIVRTDFGTENVTVRDIQKFFRRDGEDDRAGDRSYISGASTANQRIESWWGQLRRHGAGYWIAFFGELKDEGLFGGDFLDKALVQLCFTNVIQVCVYFCVFT